jgi:hypothetical protein
MPAAGGRPCTLPGRHGRRYGERELIEEAVRAVPGVERIVDNLTVVQRALPPPRAIVADELR